jgi:hypothetical protein
MQLKRMLKTTYRTAWFLAHRIRHAMATDLKTAPPLANTVEADETFMPNFEKPESKACVALIVERNGQARTKVIASVNAKNIGEFMNGKISKSATVNTDEHAAYKLALKGYKRHDRVNHGRYEYARHNPDGTVSPGPSGRAPAGAQFGGHGCQPRVRSGKLKYNVGLTPLRSTARSVDPSASIS